MLAKELISCTVLSGYNIQKDIENARFHSAFFTYEESMINDGLIHLLANGDISFAYSCSYTFSFIPCYHFFYIYEGTLTVTSGSSKSSYSKNTAALFEAGSEITYATNGKCRFYDAFILGAPLRLYHEFLPESIYYKKDSAGASVLWSHISLISRLQGELSATDIFRISKWFNDILTELCVFIENSSKKMDCVPSYLLSVKNQMDTNYAEPMSLDDLEATYRISRYKICREFSFHFGESPMRYLNSRRIDAAKRLLLTTDLSVHEVGSQVGIENTNHFINLFKKDTGTTPLSFKQAAPVSISDLHYN